MKWVTVWGNATSVADHRPETYAKNLTLRYPIVCAFGGSRIRLHFSNFCGTEAVTLSKVTVAPALSDREIDASRLLRVTFGGKTSVTIPAGEELFSDELGFGIAPGEKISVSIYFAEFTLMRSAVVVTGPLSKGFYSVGDETETPLLPLERTRTTQTYYFLTGVDVFADDRCRAIVCYGDSITSQSWPDELALLVMSRGDTSIVRRAASGTRVLREYACITYESYGLKGKHRFEREMSSLSGADTVVIQQGINDIIHPVGTEVNPFRPMSDLPTVEELENGLERYLDCAKKYGLNAYLGTLLPIYGWRTYAPFREDMKNSVNEWIRSHENCIDFDKAVRSQSDPRMFAEGNDSGDHLHPSAQAYRLMAQLAKEILF